MNVIIMPCIGNRPWVKYTSENVKSYCNRHNIDFKIITEVSRELKEGLKNIKGTRKNIESYAMKLYLVNQYADKYDRIVILDDTCMFHTDAPNIFDEIEEDKLGIYVYLEKTHSFQKEKIKGSFEAHMNPIREFQRKRNEIPILEDIKKRFNGGIMVYNKSHKKVFSLKNILYASDLLKSLYPQQTLAYYLIQKYNIETQLMNVKWHYTPGEDKGLQLKQRRYLKNIKPYLKQDKYMIHFTSVSEYRYELIKQVKDLI